MEYLSVQGNAVPALGLGTWLLEDADCLAAVPMALDMGYRHIDTAQQLDHVDLPVIHGRSATPLQRRTRC